MSATTARLHTVEIDAPDGAAAVELEQRLWHLTPTTVGHGRDWIVEIPGADSAEEIASVVRAWLDDIGRPSTSMRLDGRTIEVHTGRAHEPMHVPSHVDFIG